MVEGGRTPMFKNAQLSEFGYNLIIYPTASVYVTTKAMVDLWEGMRRDDTTETLIDTMIPFAQFNEIMGLPEIRAIEANYATGRVVKKTTHSSYMEKGGEPMPDMRAAIQEKLPLTVSEMVAVAQEYGVRVVDVVLVETELRTGKSREEILTGIMEEYAHNLKAVEIGVKDGESILLGTVASQLAAQEGSKCFEDSFLDDALLYTLGAQVGNHCVGLRPCAGTGDSCPYSGFIKAMMVHGYDDKTVAETAALVIKIGSLFRVGKVTTGCNMEGFGAGSACIAAATVSIGGGTPEQMEKAMVLALSPTIGVPCTPRVLVPALCTTHVGGAILMGMYAGRLCMKVDMTVNVPFDVMLAMAAEVHVESGRHLVPTVVEYMEPFFKRKPAVESLVSQAVRDAEARRRWPRRWKRPRPRPSSWPRGPRAFSTPWETLWWAEAARR